MSHTGPFSWGAGASSAAAEGIAPASEAARWVSAGRLRPQERGADLPARADEDLALLAAAGLRSLRITLEWARLEPEQGHLDTDEIERYRLLLGAAREHGIDVWACLHDDTLPGWFSHDERGFRDPRSRGYHWAGHVERTGEHFGDLVAGWIPIFEPSRYAYRGWIEGGRPPGQVDDAEGFAAMLEAVTIASVEAALRLRGGGHPVASAHWAVPAFAARLAPGAPPDPAAEAMTSITDESLWRAWARLLDEDVLQIPGRPPVDVPGARQAHDLLGFTYRHGVAVRGDGALLPYPQNLAPGPDGQVPWAEGLALSVHRLADRFPDRPLLLTGFGVRTNDESHREHYVREVLDVLAEARSGGIDLRGAWWNTPFDPTTSDDAATGRPGLWGPDRAERPAAALLARAARLDLPGAGSPVA